MSKKSQMNDVNFSCTLFIEPCPDDSFISLPAAAMSLPWGFGGQSGLTQAKPRQAEERRKGYLRVNLP